jgi:hypothetical protein
MVHAEYYRLFPLPGLVAASLFAQGPGRHGAAGPGDFAVVRAEFGGQ